MTRIIKFRAWDKENKVMSIVRSWDFAHGDVEMSKELQPEANKFEEELELMQYTGLKDRNGKEIYEGDVVLRDRQERAKSLHWVDFKFGAFRLRRAIGSGMVFNLGNSYHEKNLEIIGNIYENKDILK